MLLYLLSERVSEENVIKMEKLSCYCQNDEKQNIYNLIQVSI